MLDIIGYNKNKAKNIFLGLTKKCAPKVLFLSTYHSNYTRTETLLALFSELDIEVTKVIFPKGYFKVLKALVLQQDKHDVIVVSFRGHEIMPFIWMLSKRPVVFDLFVSAYDTLCSDRKIFDSKSYIGNILHCYDKLLCRISSVVLTDTAAHDNYLKNEFNAKNSEFIYLGANTELFKPIAVKKNHITTVFWYGTVIPVQGLDVILDAAEYLCKVRKDIRFQLVGPVKERRFLDNVEYIEWVEYESLPELICRSHVCLGGHFSDIDKSKRVVSGKAYQFVACGVPTIVGDNPANKEVFTSEEVYFVKHNSYIKLAETIEKVIDEKGYCSNS